VGGPGNKPKNELTPFMAEIIARLLAQVTRELGTQRDFPGATYRLQFQSGFTFHDASRLVPYWHDLGITHCYASPYLKARPGSTHGYDIINHQLLNPEIGNEEDYAGWVAALHAHGMGQILDVVPNHMGIIGNENPWWNDVLENGPSSPYAGFFDISWHASPRAELQNKLLLPILGDPYGKVLEAQQLRLEYAAGAFTVHYFEHRFPIDPSSYAMVLEQRLEELKQLVGAESPPFVEYQSILTAISHLPRFTDTDLAKMTERQREKDVIKRRLAALTEPSAPVRDFIEQTVAIFNGTSGEPHSFDLLDQLLNAQAYRLAYWRVASDEINYRRFFDINELAALSMERPEVFAATHELIFRLLRSGQVNGLRIDHPDGLYDPRQYLERLQQQFILAWARTIFEEQPEYRGQEWKDVEGPLLEAIANTSCSAKADPSSPERDTVPAGGENPLWRPLYVIVEKILGTAEPIPEDWPVYGSTGYGFLNMLNGLFIDAGNSQVFTRLYNDWLQEAPRFADIVYAKKLLILRIALSGELQMLAHQLDRLAQKDRWSRDFTLNSLRSALREIIACFPVYRAYLSEEGIHESDRKYIQRAVARAKFKNAALSTALFDFVRDRLLLKYPESADEAVRAEQRRFAGKFQQVTAPVMAKGMEDTTFYVYNRLLSLNEVGGDPDRFGLLPAALHRYFRERQAHWPWSLSSTSTHDTKRSEDVRARLNVLSELPGAWRDRLTHWGELNRSHRIAVEDEFAPDANEEYLLYQTLLGAWPLEPYSPEVYAEFVKRIQAYMRKALHEAKVHTSWINPNPAYDEAVQEFIRRILDAETNASFVQDLRSFQKRVSHYGVFNSLAQTLLKITAPGVPDLYQGTELWDFSLVDPDNRRPVDYERRRAMLNNLRTSVSAAGTRLPQYAEQLTAAKEDGRVKLYVTYRALHCRGEDPTLFTTGEYLPAESVGAKQEHVFGFVRRHEKRAALVAVPRLLTGLVPSPSELPLGQDVWQDTLLLLPEGVSNRRWRNLFTGESLKCLVRSDQMALLLADVFAHFPVALLLAED
jgi:(1->4)-alpha-D-glucan 1-alpha-D-glucosylmutase